MLAVLPFVAIEGGRIVDVNQALLDFLAWRREQVVGKPFLDFVAPHERERVRERHARRLRGESVPASYELDLLHADGSSSRVEMWVRFDGGSRVSCELADRTYLQRRRATLQRLVELGAALQRQRTEAGVLEALARGLSEIALAWARVTTSDDGTASVVEVGSSTGAVERLEAAAGMRVRNFSGPIDEHGRRAWKEGRDFIDDLALTAERYFGRIIGPIARAIARAMGLHCAIVLRIDKGDQPWQLLFVVADWIREEDLANFAVLANQVSAALDAVRLQEELVKRERLAALGELAAVVAHEIRNPLGAVFNAVGALRQRARTHEDAHLTTLLAILDEEATRMNQIVGDLLDFARPVPAALWPIRIEPIVLAAFDSAVAEAVTSVRIERDLESDLPAVRVDARLMRQAVLNLAMNAVQAVGTRGGTITLRMRREKDAVVIEIADTGPGIAAVHQPRVFEPFFTTRPTGTGLGLTVVKRIVDVHRGETTLHSVEGEGTTFVVRLPASPS